MLFGVCCIETDGSVDKGDICTDDVVQSYTSYYAFKAKCKMAMTWKGSQQVPKAMKRSFGSLLPDKPTAVVLPRKTFQGALASVSSRPL